MVFGACRNINKSSATKEVRINPGADLPATIPGVQKIERLNTMIKLEPQPGVKPQDILKISSAPAIDALPVVPDHSDIFV